MRAINKHLWAVAEDLNPVHTTYGDTVIAHVDFYGSGRIHTHTLRRRTATDANII